MNVPTNQKNEETASEINAEINAQNSRRVVRSNGRIDADLEPESINICYFEVHKNTPKTLL